MSKGSSYRKFYKYLKSRNLNNEEKLASEFNSFLNEALNSKGETLYHYLDNKGDIKFEINSNNSFNPTKQQVDSHNKLKKMFKDEEWREKALDALEKEGHTLKDFNINDYKEAFQLDKDVWKGFDDFLKNKDVSKYKASYNAKKGYLEINGKSISVTPTSQTANNFDVGPHFEIKDKYSRKIGDYNVTGFTVNEQGGVSSIIETPWGNLGTSDIEEEFFIQGSGKYEQLANGKTVRHEKHGENILDYGFEKEDLGQKNIDKQDPIKENINKPQSNKETKNSIKNDELSKRREKLNKDIDDLLKDAKNFNNYLSEIDEITTKTLKDVREGNISEDEAIDIIVDAFKNTKSTTDINKPKNVKKSKYTSSDIVARARQARQRQLDKRNGKDLSKNGTFAELKERTLKNRQGNVYNRVADSTNSLNEHIKQGVKNIKDKEKSFLTSDKSERDYVDQIWDNIHNNNNNNNNKDMGIKSVSIYDDDFMMLDKLDPNRKRIPEGWTVEEYDKYLEAYEELRSQEMEEAIGDVKKTSQEVEDQLNKKMDKLRDDTEEALEKKRKKLEQERIRKKNEPILESREKKLKEKWDKNKEELSKLKNQKKIKEKEIKKAIKSKEDSQSIIQKYSDLDDINSKIEKARFKTKNSKYDYNNRNSEGKILDEISGLDKEAANIEKSIQDAINNKQFSDEMFEDLYENLAKNKEQKEALKYLHKKHYPSSNVLEEMSSSKILKKVGFGGVMSGLNAVGTYKDARKEGHGVISSGVRAGTDFVLSETLGFVPYMALSLVKELPEATVKGSTALFQQTRKMNSASRFNVFGDAEFNDTQQLATMRQSGMELAKMSQYRLEQTLMGNEARYLHR